MSENTTINTFSDMKLTQSGKDLLSKVEAGIIPLLITRAVVGSGYLTDNQNVEELTSLVNPVPSHTSEEEGTSAIVDIQYHRAIGGGMTTLQIKVQNGDTEFYIHEIGIMAQDPDKGEILYAYTSCSSNTNGMPIYNGQNLIEDYFTFVTETGNASNIVINVTFPAEVRQEDFDAEVNARKNADEILTNNKVDIAGGKVSDTIAEFTEATERENIATGETLATIFGKIKKVFSDLAAVAFSGKYSDLTGTPANATATTDGLMSSTDKVKFDSMQEEIDSKADVGHTHTKSEITDFPTSLKNPNALTMTVNGASLSYDGSQAVSKSFYAPSSAGTLGYELVSNGSGAPVWKAPSYAVCATAGATTAKTASITNFKLVTGATAKIKFTYAHTSTTPATLNISSTGAKTIKIGGYEVTSSNSWAEDEILELTYTGSYWETISSSKECAESTKPVTIVIGNQSTKGHCDYVCDGTNDVEIFKEALTYIKNHSSSSNASGTILLKAGKYYIDNTITLDDISYPSTYIFRGEGGYKTQIIISTNNLQAFNGFEMKKWVFRDIYFNISGVESNPCFCGYSVEFEHCHLEVSSSATDPMIAGTLIQAKAHEQSATSSATEYINRDKGAVKLLHSIITISCSGDINCFSGIVCEKILIDDCRISLLNTSTNANTELNLVYSAKEGSISNSTISSGETSTTCKTSIINEGNITIVGNTILLYSSNARISHYDTSVTTVGGSFIGNTVYCKLYVYLRSSMIVGNKFLKLDSIALGSSSCFLYNQCPATIIGNYFDGGTSNTGTHGTWYLNTSLPTICKENISLGVLSKASNVPTTSLFADNLNVG